MDVAKNIFISFTYNNVFITRKKFCCSCLGKTNPSHNKISAIFYKVQIKLLAQMELWLSPGFITTFCFHVLFVWLSFNFINVETCVDTVSREHSFPLLPCRWASYWSKSTSFWRRCGRLQRIASSICHNDIGVAEHFVITKQGSKTSCC